MSDDRESCVQAAEGPIVESEGGEKVEAPTAPAPVVTAKVGQSAPDFEASALAEGGFKNIKLSDYRGQWVVLCFYPGDFTFV